MKKVIALSAVLVMGALGMACGDGGANNAAANANKMAANAMNTANAMAANAVNAANAMTANAVNAVKDAVNTAKPANAAPATNAAKPANK